MNCRGPCNQLFQKKIFWMFLQLLRAIQKGEFHFPISNIDRSGNLPYRLPIHFFSNIWLRILTNYSFNKVQNFYYHQNLSLLIIWAIPTSPKTLYTCQGVYSKVNSQNSVLKIYATPTRFQTYYISDWHRVSLRVTSSADDLAWRVTCFDRLTQQQWKTKISIGHSAGSETFYMTS